MADRAASPVVGVVLLTAVTVVAVSAVGTAVVVDPSEPPPTAAFDLAADASGEIRVTHYGGDTVDPDSLRVRVRVDGEPLAEQPPVPFFAAAGFEGGPTGAFNSATDGEWRAGQTASFRLAATNEPALTHGAVVEVGLYVDDRRIARLETTVGDPSGPSASPRSVSTVSVAQFASRTSTSAVDPPSSVSGT